MIDLSRSVITVALGDFDVDPNASFEAGKCVKLGIDGRVTNITSVADKVFGVAKWNKSVDLRTVVIGEFVTLVGTTPSNLQNANLRSGSVRVTNLTGTTVYSEGTDYTVNYVNGQITRISGGNIADGETVSVSYTYTIPDEKVDQIYGRNWYNLLDDTYQIGKITVIQNYARIYTDQYDSSQAYVAGGDLYITDDGRFTSSDAGGATKVGVCIKAPTIDDPYLGVQIG